jgi:autotransporter-associated beta strand protein
MTTRTGTVTALSAGPHTLEMYYYQGGGGNGIQLGVLPGANQTFTNSDAFFQANQIPASQLQGTQATPVLSNDVTVQGNSTININNATGVQQGNLTMAPSATLTVNSTFGPTAGGGVARFGGAVLQAGTSPRNYTFNTASGDITLGGLDNSANTSGTSTITKAGPGNLALLGSAPTGTMAYAITGGRLTTLGTSTGIGNFTDPMGDGSAVTLNGTGATLQMRVAGVDGFFNHPLTVSQSGTIEFSNENPNGAVTFNLMSVSGGTPPTITLQNNSQLTVNVLGGSTANIPGVISGSGGLTVTGGGTLTFTPGQNNTFTGSSTVNNGVVLLTAAQQLGPAASALTVSSVTDFQGGTTNPAVLATGGTTLAIPNAITLNAGTIGIGAPTATQTTPTVVTLSGALNVTGNSTVSIDGGNVAQTGTALTQSGAVTLAQNATLTYSAAGGPITASGAISGAGNLAAGNGSVLLSGNNTYTGTTTVLGGATLEARGNGQAALGTGVTTVSAGGTLSVTRPNAVTSGNIANSGTVTFDIGAANTANITSTSFTGASGSTLNIATGTVNMPTANLNLTSAGSGPGLLEGWNLWRNPVLPQGPAGGPPPTTPSWFTAIDPKQPNLGNGFNGGVVPNIRQANNIAPNGNNTDNSIPNAANNFEWVNNVSFIYSGMIKTSASGIITAAENIDDGASVTINNQTIVNDNQWNVATKGTFTGQPNTYYPFVAVVFNQGGGAGPSAQNNAAGTPPQINWDLTKGVVISDNNNATLDANTYFNPGTSADPLGASRFIFSQPAAILNVAAGATLNVGQLTGGANVTLNGTLILANQTAATASAAGPITVATGTGTLQVGTNQTLTIGDLSIAGTALSKVGAGTLLVNGAGGTGTGALNATAGTVGGIGKIPGALLIDTNATVAPGANPGTSLGVLAVGAGLTLNGTYMADVATGNLNDQIAVTGNLTLGPASKLTLPATNTYDPAAANSYYVLVTFTGTRTGTFSTMSPLPTGYNLVYNANSIALSPVPEPAHVLLLCGGAAGALRWWRRRRAAGQRPEGKD